MKNVTLMVYYNVIMARNMKYLLENIISVVDIMLPCD